MDLATADAAMARAATAAAVPDAVNALTQVASQRAEHARALALEIARAAGRPAPTDASSASSSAASSATSVAGTPGTAGTMTSPPPPPPSVKDVLSALRRSADSAAQLAPTLSGYRAGLMGSIAAACTTSYTVGFGDREAS